MHLIKELYTVLIVGNVDDYHDDGHDDDNAHR
jgi:hypothetical protein